MPLDEGKAEMSAPHGQSVLLIDDDPDSIRLLRDALRVVCQVLYATTGLEGVKVALLKNPDLVLLDINMPGMDGYEVCTRLKGNPKTRHIPVIFLSANEDSEDEAKGLELGAIDYITKPFNRSIVAARVRNHLLWKRQYDQLRQMRKASDRSVQAKSLFMANMSHEIRGPMNAIIGMTDLVLRSELNPEQRHFLEIVLQSSEALLSLLNSILDLSKIEAGKLELEALAFDPLDVVEKACETMALRARNENLELLHDVSFAVPQALVGDPTQFRQIIINLLGNAIKFTRQGEVVVRVSLEEDGEQPDSEPSGGERTVMLLVSVSDTGIGIPPDKQEVIFKSFKQAELTTARRFGGTGLGLTISRQLAELMGGAMWVESEVGVGSTFYFTARFQLPRRDPESVPTITGDGRPAAAPRDLSGLRILVAEGNQTARAILSSILSRCQAQVSRVAGGVELVEQLHRAERTGEPFDILLLDCELANAGEINLPERFVALADGFRHIITLLPPGARLHDIPWCERLKRGGGLIKPVKRGQLLDTIQAVMEGRHTVSTRRAATASTPPMHPLKILLTEDDEDSRLLTVQILKRAGHTVVSATNGREALALLEGDRFDLILMDVQMPEMDGIQTTRFIRQGRAAVDVNIPILGVSARAMTEDTRECLEAGMDDFLPKPFRKDDLLGKILQFSRAVKETGQAAAGAPPPGAAAGPGRFGDEAATILVELEEALRRGDTATAETRAQWLKETAQSLGEEQVRRHAFQVVMAARSGDAQRALLYLNRLRRVARQAGAL